MGAKTNLVLGGSGLIGKELQKQLKEEGEEVINLDIKEGTDLRHFSLDKYKDVDYVWFLAWDSGGAKYLNDRKNFHNIYLNNAQLCQNIFQFIEKHKKPFLFTSSQLAASDTPYGLTKLLGEEWGRVLNGKIVRLWNVYGWEEPGERSHVIPDLVSQGIIDKQIKLLTSGEEKRQFIYVKDCTKSLLKIRDAQGDNFHLTNGKWVSIKELAEVIGNHLDVPVLVGSQKGYECLNKVNLNHKLFEETYTLDDGLKEIIGYAKEYINHKKVNAQ